MRSFSCVLLCAGALACAPRAQTGEPRLARGSAIVGGSPSADDAVFLLAVKYGNGQSTFCSATLIASRTLLTAAHCLDPAVAGAGTVKLLASNQQSWTQTTPADQLEVVQTRWDPRFDPTADLQHDLGLALLERAPAAIPKPWNESVDVGGFGGKVLRAVGFGRTRADLDSPPERRSADMLFRQLSPTHIFLGDLASYGICFGDSGGPALHTFEDGKERVVGVHSMTGSSDCTDGAAIRVDAYRELVEGWLSEMEGIPACATDGRCKPGCAPVDQDCACARDGTCSAQCLDAASDPDCPFACGLEGTCARVGCPRQDPDCRADGAPCADAGLCLGARCAADPQHEGGYCSRACAEEGCAPGMECLLGACRFEQLPEVALGAACPPEPSFCREGRCVAGDGGSVCRRQCALDGRCPPGEACAAEPDGGTYCASGAAAASVAVPRVLGEGAGCSTAGGWGGALVLMGAFASLRAEGRRRRSS